MAFTSGAAVPTAAIAAHGDICSAGSRPVTPASLTSSVQATPSQYRSS
jgi:hypothetical protein